MISAIVPFLSLFLAAQAPAAAEPTVEAKAPADVRKGVIALLDRPKVPLDPVVLESKPGKDGLVTERLSFATEKHADGQIERVPALVVRPADQATRRPAVIVLHGTGGNKESQRPFLVDLAKRGIVGIAIDGRYHGARAEGKKGTIAYNDAITRAWKASSGESHEHPFFFDTCWDIWRTLDYLGGRSDVDAKRIGVIGFSKGGIETWLAGAVDDRVAVAVPAIAVQSFAWSLENGRWQGRAKTIAAAHEAAARDLGEPEVNARVCRALWDKVIPGILGQFDCPSMIRLFAGRPLLILSGDQDPNCPVGGARIAIASAEEAFRDAKASDKLKVMLLEGVGHSVTKEQREAALEWFTRWLKP